MARTRPVWEYVDRHEQMRAWDWEAQYDKRWDRIPNDREIRDPANAVLTKHSDQRAQAVGDLGALSVKLGRHEQARAWFDLGYRGCLFSLKRYADELPVFAKFEPRRRGTLNLEFCIGRLIMLARLGHRDLPPVFGEHPLATSSQWLLDYATDEIEDFIKWKEPSIKFLSTSNSLCGHLFAHCLYPILITNEANVVRDGFELLRRFEDWHARAPGGVEGFDARGGLLAREAAVARALMAGDGPAFVAALRSRTGHMTCWDASDKFTMVTDWHYLALYAEAWKRCGPLPPVRVNRVPEGFNPEAVWNAPLAPPRQA